MINSSISEREFQEYSELIEQGYSQRSACEVLSLSRTSIQRYIKKLNEYSNYCQEHDIDGDYLLASLITAKTFELTKGEGW